jgi:hypothetical protein
VIITKQEQNISMAINKAKYYPELSYVMDRSILHKRGNIVCALPRLINTDEISLHTIASWSVSMTTQ